MFKRCLLSLAMMGVLVLASGCGSSEPQVLDAAADAALRAELSRVEAVEQERHRLQPPAGSVSQVPGANFQEPSF